MDLNQAAAQLLLQVKQQQSTGSLRKQLSAVPMSQLQAALRTEEQKKAFWSNLYNAYFQILRIEQAVNKPDIYRKKLVALAGHDFSLDDIEHGILRKYRWKWALGYLPDLFAPRLIKQLAVHRIDYRIHFALNCGAKSCPPIAFYSPERLDQQLDLATRSFLETEVVPQEDAVYITRLFQWYRGDFGGRRGIRQLLRRHLGMDTRGKKLLYREYDWREELTNFRELE
jgi:hypothetical protein